MGDAFDLTMVNNEDGTTVISVSHLSRWGGSGDAFATARGATPADALRALAQQFDDNDQFPDPDPEEA